MSRKVAIVGVGYTPFRPTSRGLSYKELMFEAASRAYADAGLDPRSDIDSFLSCSEDYNEGTSIFDEYVPDQIGAAQRPVYTVAGDGLHGLATAYMQIASGIVDVVAVEAHSKASNILTPNQLLALAMDPIFARFLDVNPHFLAGLEADLYLEASGGSREQWAAVVAKNHGNALANPAAAYPAHLSREQVLAAPPAFSPLSELDVAQRADGAVVLVLAAEGRAKRLAVPPAWVRGIGWAVDSYALDSRQWAAAEYARLAAQMAYRMAGIEEPAKAIDFAEVDDSFSFKELQHLEALGLFRAGQAGAATLEGATARGGDLPVNPSGGSLGCGHLLEATGLHRVAEVVLQLRGEAGPRQLRGVRIGLAQSWRGIPSASGAVAVLSAD